VNISTPRGRRRPPFRLWVYGASAMVVVTVATGAVVSLPRGRPPLAEGTTILRPTEPATGVDAGTSVTGRATLPPGLRPTPAAPLHVLEIGDSLGIDLGDQLRSQLEAAGSALTTVASLGDSGLSNVTDVDWPVHLASLLATDRPQVVVVFIGANDDQGLEFDGSAAAPGTLAWVGGYSQRVDDILREATDAGARVVWVGMPRMANPDLDAAMGREDIIYQRETQASPDALYVSSNATLAGPSGLYATTGEDLSGHPVPLRTPDGVHLTPAGAAVLARAVVDAIDTHWHISLMTTAVQAGALDPGSS
jgi:hypothetical protein